MMLLDLIDGSSQKQQVNRCNLLNPRGNISLAWSGGKMLLAENNDTPLLSRSIQNAFTYLHV